jgi:hypothetical protein
VLIQGPAHHVTEAERAALQAGIDTWPPGEREMFVRIIPFHITGRRVKPV